MRTILLGAGALVVLGIYWFVTGLQHNIARAKTSGLHYIVAREYTLILIFTLIPSLSLRLTC